MPQATTNKRLLPTINAAVLTAWLRLRANIVVIAQQKAAAIASVAGQISGVVDRPAAISTPPKPTIVASQRHGPTISPSTGLRHRHHKQRRGEIERHQFGQLQRARSAVIGEPRHQDEQPAQRDRREIAPLHHVAQSAGPRTTRLASATIMTLRANSTSATGSFTTSHLTMASWALNAAQPQTAKAMPVSVRDASVFAGDMGASNEAEETTSADSSHFCDRGVQ